MTAATATPEMLSSPTPRGVNLDDVERGMRSASGTDLTEAKEAVVEALLQLAVQRCTGEGSAGEFIFGVKPSAKLVSGFLLPRFDATGQGDETSDIHLATMGIDLQVAADHTGEIAVIPDFVIYARMLPTWEDLVDPRHDIAPRSELSRETRQAVEDRARQYINEAIAALPPIEEQDEPDERPGDAVAEAQRARELADQAEQRIAEEGQSDADALGQNRAAQAAAQRSKESRLLAAKARWIASPRAGKEIPPSRRSAGKHSVAHLPSSVSVYAKIEREQRTYARLPQTIWRSTLGMTNRNLGHLRPRMTHAPKTQVRMLRSKAPRRKLPQALTWRCERMPEYSTTSLPSVSRYP